MATSGTLTSNKWNSAYWSFEWSSSVVSPGQTKVTWNLYARGRSSSPTQYITKIRLYINGSIKYELWDEAATFTGKKYSSGSFTVNHGYNGEGSFTARLYVTKIYDAIDAKNTQTVSLDYNKPNSVNFTYPTIFSDEEIPINITYENLTGSAVQSIKVGITASDRTTIIPLQTMATNSNGDIGSDTYSFNFSSEIDNLYTAAKDTNSLKVYLTLQEEYSDYTYTENKVVTFNVVNANPTFVPKVVDSNSATQTLTGSTNEAPKFILGYSNASITFNTSTKKQATIVSQTVTDINNNVLRSGDGVISPIKVSTLNFKAVDSRGNSVSTSQTLNTVTYTKPACQIKGISQNSGTSLKVIINGSVFYGSFGAQTNTFTLKYRYKNDTVGGSYSNWISVDPSITSNSFSQSFDVTVDNAYQNYTFQVQLSDKLETVTSNQFVFTTGLEPILKVKNSSGTTYTVGVIKGQTNGKSAYELAKAAGYTGTEAEFGQKMLNPAAFPIGAIYTTFDSTSPASRFGGTWSQLKNRFIIGAGDTYALDTQDGSATCTLTTSTMPSHKHQSPYQTYATSASAYLIRYRDRTVYDSYQYMDYTGGGEAHNNMPPYVGVYVWQRTG